MIDSNSWRTEDLTMGANAKFKETLQKAKQLRSIHLSIATHAQKSELQLLQGLSYVQASRLWILMWSSKLKWLRELYVAKPMGLQKCASLIMFVQMHADDANTWFAEGFAHTSTYATYTYVFYWLIRFNLHVYHFCLMDLRLVWWLFAPWTQNQLYSNSQG